MYSFIISHYITLYQQSIIISESKILGIQFLFQCSIQFNSIQIHLFVTKIHAINRYIFKKYIIGYMYKVL